MQKDLQDKIRETIAFSKIADEDKAQLFDASAKFSNNDAEAFLELIVENPQALIFFNDNLKLKKQALESGNKEAWDKILENEKEFLSAIKD